MPEVEFMRRLRVPVIAKVQLGLDIFGEDGAPR
jgi:hypothetical protein